LLWANMPQQLLVVSPPPYLQCVLFIWLQPRLICLFYVFTLVVVQWKSIVAVVFFMSSLLTNNNPNMLCSNVNKNISRITTTATILITVLENSCVQVGCIFHVCSYKRINNSCRHRALYSRMSPSRDTTQVTTQSRRGSFLGNRVTCKCTVTICFEFKDQVRSFHHNKSKDTNTIKNLTQNPYKLMLFLGLFEHCVIMVYGWMKVQLPAFLTSPLNGRYCW
jgi:hypothetical protein